MRMLANNQCLGTSQIWIFCRSSKRVWQRVLRIRMMSGISILVCGPREFLGMKDKFWHRAQAILTYLYLGLSLRELIHEFKYQTLVLFKCCLLQPKVFSSLQLQLYLLTWPDAVLRVTLRASLHDAILTYLINTWTNSSLARLR